MDSAKSILVVSAHAADFVWRAGGAIALYRSRGCRVRVLCLSFGERGESQGAWKQAGMTIERVKETRRTESETAAEILGAEIRFFDCGDYPLQVSAETIDAMVVEFRKLQPEFALTHSARDPYNPDHPAAYEATLRARVYAQALGYTSQSHPALGKAIEAPPLFTFEPHQPEQCDFKPQVLLDITPVFDVKRRAMESMKAQEHLWEYYIDLAKRRGTQAVRNSGNRAIKYVEAFERVYPQVTDALL
jgi:4-oxalomesaconate hydratase